MNPLYEIISCIPSNIPIVLCVSNTICLKYTTEHEYPIVFEVSASYDIFCWFVILQHCRKT